MATIFPAARPGFTESRRMNAAQDVRRRFETIVTQARREDAPSPLLSFRSCTGPIVRAVVYIYEDYASPIQVEDMANKAQMSHYHFIRRFKAEVGCTPHDYLMTLRMWRAQELLAKRPELKIRQVGHLVGYNDPTAFTRAFRERVGMTPLRYRLESLREMHKNEEVESGPETGGSLKPPVP